VVRRRLLRDLTRHEGPKKRDHPRPTLKKPWVRDGYSRLGTRSQPGIEVSRSNARTIEKKESTVRLPLATAACAPRALPQHLVAATAATSEAVNEQITDFQGEIEPITQQTLSAWATSRRSSSSNKKTQDLHLQAFHGASRTRTDDLLGAIQGTGVGNS
jgi:hypothetical protein